MSMEKEFIPYNEALELKELEFDEPCFGSYCQTPKFDEGTFMLGNTYNLKAPTFSQAFRWFREKYNLQSYIRHECPDVEAYYDFVINEDGYDVIKNTYEEAELACLRKLIEIVKQKS